MGDFWIMGEFWILGDFGIMGDIWLYYQIWTYGYGLSVRLGPSIGKSISAYICSFNVLQYPDLPPIIGTNTGVCWANRLLESRSFYHLLGKLIDIYLNSKLFYLEILHLFL